MERLFLGLIIPRIYAMTFRHSNGDQSTHLKILQKITRLEELSLSSKLLSINETWNLNRLENKVSSH